MHGLGTEDNPLFPGMHEAAAMVTGATLAAARAVWTSAARHGVSLAGGLRHAMAGSASGLCVYNDPAVAIAWLLSQGAERTPTSTWTPTAATVCRQPCGTTRAC